MSHGYKFYIQRVQKADDGTYQFVEGTKKSLEDDYEGLKYSKLDGISTIGKPKNVYTEKYADGDKLRVYMPKFLTHDATTLTLTLYFFGENRNRIYEYFIHELRQSVHRYWDTARKCWFDFVLLDETKATDENWYKGQPYFKVDLKMQNIYGETYFVPDDW